MSLLVLSYPEISQEDFNWIQKIRAEHDILHYKIVDPHFTIVFAVDDINRNEFIDHVKEQTQGFKKITFILRNAVVNKDSFSEYTYVFLVPDESRSFRVTLTFMLKSREDTRSKFISLGIAPALKNLLILDHATDIMIEVPAGEVDRQGMFHVSGGRELVVRFNERTSL